MSKDTDRELLEFAAKAAGIPLRVVGAEPGYYALYPGRDGVEKFCCMDNWNPLTDDGDAFRLAVACLPFYTLQYAKEDYEICNLDGIAATRRAIVRAAAEIGRNME